MLRLFRFDSLITPSIIKFLFFVGVAISVLGALGAVVNGLSIMGQSPFMGLGTILVGLVLVLVGIVISRVATEMTLVLFMIRDELAWQRENLQNSVQK